MDVTVKLTLVSRARYVLNTLKKNTEATLALTVITGGILSSPAQTRGS